jgi:SAM-dependent methyltransferase
MGSLFKKIYYSKFFGGIFHTLVYSLQKELEDCESVLDLGCGPSSPSQYCSNIKYSVGVEAFKPYLEKAKKLKTHSEFIAKKIEEVDFPPKSFDAVIMLEVLEHLSKEAANKILLKSEKWARKKIIVSSPNGFWSQGIVDNNVLQKHLSGWTIEEFQRRGFRVFGLSGLKVLRKESESKSMDDNLLSTVRFKPEIFWFIILALSQAFVYFFPALAFELFAVKQKV